MSRVCCRGSDQKDYGPLSEAGSILNWSVQSTQSPMAPSREAPVGQIKRDQNPRENTKNEDAGFASSNRVPPTRARCRFSGRNTVSSNSFFGVRDIQCMDTPHCSHTRSCHSLTAGCERTRTLSLIFFVQPDQPR